MINNGLVFAFSASILWGIAYSLDQKALVNVSPVMLVFLNAIATLIVTAPMFTNYRTVKLLSELTNKETHFLVMAIVTTISANLLILASIKVLGASTAAILEISYPFFVFLFSYIFFGTQLNLSFLLGSIFIFAGSFIITSSKG